MKGFLLYEGPSMLNGQLIVCIVTDPDQARLNAKTQRVIQTYILAANIDPIEAIQGGWDFAICGNCKHRGAGGTRSCYVQVWSAPRNVWLAYKRGKYQPALEPSYVLCDEIVRLGTYGDPAAVPIKVWEYALRHIKAPIGYTHQWRVGRFTELKTWCVASVDNEIEKVEASAMGWRTFRVRRSDQPVLKNEVVCPASAEAGHKTNCQECRACGGESAKATCDITIIAHGDKGKVKAFNELGTT